MRAAKKCLHSIAKLLDLSPCSDGGILRWDSYILLRDLEGRYLGFETSMAACFCAVTFDLGVPE